jgi:hypothetical protein
MHFYIVDCADNDSYAFRGSPTLTVNTRIHQTLVPEMSGAPVAGVRRCHACGEIIDKWTAPLDGRPDQPLNHGDAAVLAHNTDSRPDAPISERATHD